MSRLGINIDHVATLRNARGEDHPNILEIAKIVKSSGANSITIHLREDRRHINDKDLSILCNSNFLINMEMAANLLIRPTPRRKSEILYLLSAAGRYWRPHHCPPIPDARSGKIQRVSCPLARSAILSP